MLGLSAVGEFALAEFEVDQTQVINFALTFLLDVTIEGPKIFGPNAGNTVRTIPVPREPRSFTVPGDRRVLE